MSVRLRLSTSSAALDAHALMAVACEALGWRHEVLSEPDSILATNVGWLVGFRVEPENCAEVDADLRLLGEPFSLRDVDERFEWPALVRPVVFHLLWKGVLACDILAAKTQRRHRAEVRRRDGERLVAPGSIFALDDDAA